jgi:hypothetical protein
MRNPASLASLAFTFALTLAVACGSSSDSSAPPGPGGGVAGARADAGASSHGDDGTGAGDGSASTPPPSDAASDTAPSGPFTPASHAPFPVVKYLGAPILAATKVVTITFAADANAAQLESFGAAVAATPWWDTVRAGYCEPSSSTCVGDGPAGASVELKTAAATSYTDSFQGKGSTFQQFLSQEITSGALPKPDASTLYLFYVPQTTTITVDGDTTCNTIDGYHNWMTVGSQPAVYAVVAECAPYPGGTLDTVQMATLTASHEIAEAATNPEFTANTAGFQLDDNDPNNWGWLDVQFGGEVGDMCQDYFGLGQDETTEGGFSVQRIWSATSAAAGHDPCVPIPAGEVYFNAAPTKPRFVLDVGQTVTFEVDAFSEAPMSDWVLTAMDATDPKKTYLTFSIQGGTSDGDAGARTTVNNGAKVQVSMTLIADPGGTTNQEADALLVSSIGDLGTATVAHTWPIGVLSTADAADAGVSATSRTTGARHGGRVHPRR